MNNKDMLDKLLAGVENIAPKDEFEKKIYSGKKLVIKLGADPTAPDLHLGHAVVFSKLRQFQDYGHRVVFLIGDFTARIGDPTGKSKTRPPLSQEDIDRNAKTYITQLSKILDVNKLEVVFNSHWLDQLTSRDWITLCSKVTIARILEREDFSKRLKECQPLSLHEVLYPLIQGYDSVYLNADVELGGTDQTFNLLMGRFLQEQYNQEPQVIMTLPILPGLDGIQKMSKSLNNAISLQEDPSNAYGKIMSISDDLMWTYWQLLLHKTDKEIKQLKLDVEKNVIHPMNLKKDLAFKIIERFWSLEDAIKSRESFENLFQKRDFSSAKEININLFESRKLSLLNFIKNIEPQLSSSEIKRLINQKALMINNKNYTDYKELIDIISGMEIRIGKHKFYKIK